jgi:ribosomal-protein-alanine N-acetyltransferase
MKIRLAHSSDLKSILAIEQSVPPAAHWSREKYEEIFAQADLRRMLVADEDASIKGFIVVRTLGREWEIENIAVEIASMRRGLGSQLLHALLSQARSEKVMTIYLEVRESNHAARRLYEKFLFQEGSRRLNYYHDPADDAIVYLLYL